MATRVVHVNDPSGFDVYIGRAVGGKGRSFKASKWANPYKLGLHGTREQVIEAYRAWFLSRPNLQAEVRELRGKVLGCWCKPAACHGDILAEFADRSA